jgi:hypothetical protein
MAPEEAFEWVNSLGSRKKKLDPYKEWIVAWLQEYPHLNASQIQDCCSRNSDFTVGESTTVICESNTRRVSDSKIKVVRQYEAVEEQSMENRCKPIKGNTSKDTDQREIKLYCICFYFPIHATAVEWQTALRHMMPFVVMRMLEYFGGMPEKLFMIRIISSL